MGIVQEGMALVPISLLQALVDEESCEFDHDGNCQAHDWWGDEPCPQATVKRILRGGPA